MIKCILFSRVSTTSQHYEEQTKELYNQAFKEGYKESEITKIEYKESAIKLTAQDRLSVQQLYNLIENNPISCVIVREISRLARRPDVLFEIRDKLITNKIQLICCNPFLKLLDEKGEMTQTANIMFSLFSAISESEMTIKQERMKEGKSRLKAQGLFQGGRILFGYELDPKKHFILHKQNSETVKRIFSMYASGLYSGTQIASILYNEGAINQPVVKSRNRFVLGIIKNKKYIGDKTYPQIIDKDTFNKANETIAKFSNLPRTNFKQNVYMGHKLLFSIENNKAMALRKKDVQYYEPILHYGISMNQLDSVLLYCADYAYNRHCSDDLEKLSKKLTNELKSITKRLSTYTKEENKIKEAFDRLEERIIYGNISEEKATYIHNKLSKDLQILSNSRDTDLSNKNLYETQLNSIRDKYGDYIKKNIYDLTPEQQQEMIREEIQRVEIGKEADKNYCLIVYYRNPLLIPENLTEQGLQVGSVYKVNSKTHQLIENTKDGDHEIQYKYIRRFNRKRGPK